MDFFCGKSKCDFDFCFVIVGTGSVSRNTGAEVGQVHETAGERRLQDSAH